MKVAKSRPRIRHTAEFRPNLFRKNMIIIYSQLSVIEKFPQ